MYTTFGALFAVRDTNLQPCMGCVNFSYYTLVVIVTIAAPSDLRSLTAAQLGWSAGVGGSLVTPGKRRSSQKTAASLHPLTSPLTASLETCAAAERSGGGRPQTQPQHSTAPRPGHLDVSVRLASSSDMHRAQVVAQGTATHRTAAVRRRPEPA